MVGPTDEKVQWTGVVPSNPGTLVLELTKIDGSRCYLLLVGGDVTDMLLVVKDAARMQRMESMK